MTRKDKRLLTVIATLVAIVAVSVLTLVPYARKLQFYDKTIAERQTQIINYKSQIANKPLLASEIDFVNGLMAKSNLFIKAGDQSAASSQLLKLVKGMIESSGGQINAINVLNRQSNATAKSVVGVKVNFTADNPSYVKWLRKLTASKPLLNITKAQLKPLLSRRRNISYDTGKVRINVEIEAFYTSGVK